MNDYVIVPNEHLLLEILMGGGVHKGRILASKLGVSPITIRHIINRYRSIGYPICSSSKGYHISNDPDMIRKTINGYEHRIMKMQKAVDGLKVALNEAVSTSD